MILLAMACRDRHTRKITLPPYADVSSTEKYDGRL